MKRFLRCTAFLLVVAMLLAMGVACKKKDDGEDADTTTAENVTTTTASGEKPPNDRDDLPDGLDFGGKVFTIYSRVQPQAAGEFFQESRDGGVIAEAVFDRNAKVKERLNCKIENKEVSGNTNDDTMLTEITAMVQGGTAEYQILTTAGYRMCTLSYNGLLVNYNDLEYVDLNKDYYSQGYNRALSAGKAQYLATGTFTLGYYRYLMVNLFNKKMFAEKGVEEPYQLVRDQKWTFEAMANIVKLFYNDNNGDGNHDNEDTYGYVLFTGPDSSFTDGFMSACNLRVLSKDSNNYYTIDINQGRFSDAIDEMLGLIFNSGTLSGKNLSHEITYGKFSNSTAAMITTRLYGVRAGGDHQGRSDRQIRHPAHSENGRGAGGLHLLRAGPVLPVRSAGNAWRQNAGGGFPVLRGVCLRELPHGKTGVLRQGAFSPVQLRHAVRGNAEPH